MSVPVTHCTPGTPVSNQTAQSPAEERAHFQPQSPLLTPHSLAPQGPLPLWLHILGFLGQSRFLSPLASPLPSRSLTL